jgi:hypothetical protein
MAVPVPQLGGFAEVRGVLTVAPDGRPLGGTGGGAAEAATAAAALGALAAAGQAARLGALVGVRSRGARSSAVSAVRADAVLHVTLDPARPFAPVEGAVRDWAGAPHPSLTPDARASPPRAVPPPLPASAPSAPPHAPAAGRADGAPDPWAALRRALSRSRLADAAALKGELCGRATGRPGAEPTSREACDRALRALFEGVGSVMAGDALGGSRILRPLAGDAQPNLTFRWLALHWSARAALRCGAVPAARAFVQSSLALARELDVEARAVSQWTAAEVLAHDRDPTKALAWLAEARARFARADDAWGVGQTWLTEARLEAAARRWAGAAEAAARAAEALPGSEEPQVALARLALLQDDVEGAAARLAGLHGPHAERLLALVDAIRARRIALPDAADYLREQDAVPGPRPLAALARVATAAPRFLQARETLAWMLLRLGRAADAAAQFRWLLAQPGLAPGERASATLGLGCATGAEPAADPPAGDGAPAPAASPAPARGAPPAGAAGASPTPAPRAQDTGLARPEPVFSGQLGDFALPDLLEFLRSARRTGLLVCSSAAGLGTLRFREGRLAGGAAPAVPGLAALLARAGALAPAALAALGPSDPGDGLEEVLAARLVERGLADAAAVAGALELRVEHAVRELVRWTDGEFAFRREDPASPGPRVAVSLDPQGVLLAVFTEQDERARDATA